MKIERETIKYEIGNLKISMKYYIAKRRRRYFISWDTSKTAKTIYLYLYIYENEDWKKDNQIWEWQFHDINEIFYRQRKKIFHIMGYIQNSKNDIYIYIYKWRLRERQSNMRLAISWYQWNIILPKEEDDISYHEIHPKQNKRYIYTWRLRERQSNMRLAISRYQWNIMSPIKEDDMSYHEIRQNRKYDIYIYMHEDWERDNQIWGWQVQDINEILYRHKTKTIFHIMRYIQNSKSNLFIFIYLKMKIEREATKFEIGNLMTSMKNYIVKKKRRWYFISWDTFETAKKIYIYI